MAIKRISELDPETTLTAASEIISNRGGSTRRPTVQMLLDVLGAEGFALGDVAQARTNLGLGTAAVQSAGAFATAAQGGKADTALQPGTVPGRNLIINGSGRINQRGYTSAAATSGANEYTLDRWRVVTSGQALSFTGDDSGRTMTAPAGGVEQVIEGVNITGGDYVISFTGSATCTVNGTPRASGDTFTLTANTNVTVRFTGGTFTDVQLEPGTVATPFEYRFAGQELALCQRYYEAGQGNVRAAVNTPTGSAGYGFIFAVTKRAEPTIAASITDSNAYDANFTVDPLGPSGAAASARFTNANSAFVTFDWSADAEI